MSCKVPVAIPQLQFVSSSSLHPTQSYSKSSMQPMVVQEDASQRLSHFTPEQGIPSDIWPLSTPSSSVGCERMFERSELYFARPQVHSQTLKLDCHHKSATEYVTGNISRFDGDSLWRQCYGFEHARCGLPWNPYQHTNQLGVLVQFRSYTENEVIIDGGELTGTCFHSATKEASEFQV